MNRIWLVTAMVLLTIAFGCKFEWDEEDDVPRIHPQAAIGTSGTSGTAPYTVVFDGSASLANYGKITAYWWIFGGGDEAAGPVVAHEFAAPGTYQVTLVVTNSADLASQAQVVVSVSSGGSNQPPVADISTGSLTGDAPLTVSFDGTGSSDPDGTIVSHEWFFGDGASASGATANYTYETPGTYTAMLVVTDDAGSSDSASVTVSVTGVVNEPPSAVVDASLTAGRSPLTVIFSGSRSSDSDGFIADYAWDFGDGATDSGISVAHTFGAGTFTVTLTVTDNAGDSDAAQVDIDVNAPPTAVISASPIAGDAPLTVSFNGSGSSDSDGAITGYAWNFGDGAVGSGAIVSHTYSTPGQYTALLVVTDGGGATGTALVLIIATATPNVPPTAAAGANPTSGLAPLPVDFNSTGSADSDGFIADYAWDFGDGATATGATASHEYGSPGIYTATLTVTDNDGDTDTATVTVTVTAPIPNEPPVAVISADPVSGDVPLTVSFGGLASYDNDGSITSYAWDFGDGNAGSGATLDHEYTSAGSYTARLTVEDDRGAPDTASVTITVSGTGPTAIIQANVYSGLAQLDVNFNGSGSTGGSVPISSFDWNFGDGGGSSAVSPSHTFDAGVYWVTLTVTDTLGATDLAQTVIAVASWDEEVVRLTNVERWTADGGANLPPLRKESHIDAAALRHSTDMALNNHFDHTGTDGSSPGDRMRDAGYNWFTYGENIAAGYTSPAAVVAAWMASPGHHANIMYPSFREIGVSWLYVGASIYRHWWTQDFGARVDIYPVVINREEIATSSSVVNLYIHGSGWADQMMVSNFSDFAGASWEAPAPDKTWTLEAGLGLKTVYVKLRSGTYETTYSDSIAVVEQ